MSHSPHTKVTTPRPRLDLGELLRQFGSLFLASASLCATVRKVLYRLMACRTDELGGHMAFCEDCGFEEPAYNSCGDRHCPKCQSVAGTRWVAKRMKTLLPTHYFHTVFTLPAELRPLILGNRKPLLNLLFGAVSGTLLELSADPRWLGATPGFTLVLHTWARDLNWHPHIHGVITGGGLTPDGRWKSTRGKFLLPIAVMSALFRGKFLAGLHELYLGGKLTFTGGQEALAQPAAFRKLMRKVYARSWVVFAREPFASPEIVYRYLGHYTHRFGLSNRKLLEVSNGQIRLRTRGERSVVLKLEEFFRRFTLHIMPEHFIRIRHYGLMSTAHLGKKLAQARRVLMAAAGAPPAGAEERSGLEKAGQESAAEKERRRRCPKCEGPMSLRGEKLEKPRGSWYERKFGESMAPRLEETLAQGP